MTREEIQKSLFNLRVDNLYKNVDLNDDGAGMCKVPVMIPFLQARNIVNNVLDELEYVKTILEHEELHNLELE